jgi:chemotaxis protein methyltransferase CheR
MLKITPEDIIVIAKYVNELTGIVLDESKAYLMESRLGPLAKEFECSNYSELYFKAKNEPSKMIQKKIIDAITTNETFFFRDNSPFELLKHKILPDFFDKMMESNTPRLNIWSAACSTGQEVYSAAIIMKELLAGMNQWSIRMIGTDISDAAITQASYGSYNRTEINRGLHPSLIAKYFHDQGNNWRVNDELRSMVMFKKHNLLDSFIGMGKQDIILCRNVAIYFSPESRKNIFNRLADQLNPGGVLIIGASESLIGVTDRFQRKDYMRSVFYELIK